MTGTTADTKTIHPDVTAYYAALTELRKDMERTRVELDKKYRVRDGYGDAADDAGKEWADEWICARRRWGQAQVTALSILRRSEQPQIAWLAADEEVVTDYPGQLRVVLEMVPVTLAELDDLADQDDWCGAWHGPDGIRDRMIEAGLFAGVPMPTPARKAIHRWATESMNLYPSLRRGLDAMLDDLVAETLAAGDQAPATGTAPL